MAQRVGVRIVPVTITGVTDAMPPFAMAPLRKVGFGIKESSFHLYTCSYIHIYIYQNVGIVPQEYALMFSYVPGV